MSSAIEVLARLTGDSSSMATAFAKAADAGGKMAAAHKAASASVKESAFAMSAGLSQASQEAVMAAQKTVLAEQEMAAKVKAASEAMAKGVVADFEGMSKASIEKSAMMSRTIVEQQAAAAEKVSASHKKMFTNVTKAAFIATAAVGAFSIDLAAKFQKSTELLKTAGGMTQQNLDIARKGILDVSQATGVTAENLAAGMYIVSKVTKDAADGLIILRAAAQGAAAEGVDMGTMTTALTSIMTTYNIKAKDAVSTENALVAAAGASKATMQEFAGALSTVLPIAQSAHLSFAQIGGAIATMTQHGTSADEATQELRNGIQNLLAPNASAVQMMNQFGISSTSVAKNLGKQGLTGTLQTMTEAVLSHVKGGQVLLNNFYQSTTAGKDLSTMFGTMQGPLKDLSQKLLDGSISARAYSMDVNKMDVASASQGHQFETLLKKSQGFGEALKSGGPTVNTYVQALSKMMGGTTGLQTALMLTGDNMPGFQARVAEIGGAMKKTGKDISTNADTQATFAAQLARTKATVEALMIALGTRLLPVVQNVLNGFMSFVHYLEAHQTTAKLLGMAVLGLAGAFVVLQVALAVSAAIAGGWVTIIVGAIALLVGGFILAYNKIGWFKDGVNAAMKWIGEAFHNSIDWIVHTLIPTLVTSWKNFIQWFPNTIGMFKDFFKNTTGMFSDFGRNTGGMMMDWRNNTRGMFGDFFKHTGGMFGDFFKNTFGMFGDFFKNTFGMFHDFFGKVVQGFKGWWHDPIGETEKFFTSTSDGLKNWELSLSVSFGKFFLSVKAGFDKWFAGVVGMFVDWFKQTVGMFTDWFKNTEGMFTDWFKQTVGMFTDFFKNTSGMLTDWKKNTIGMFTDFFKNTVGMFTDWFKNTGNGLTDWKKNTVGMLTDWFKNTVGMFTGFFKNTVGMFVDWFKNTVGMFVDWHNQLTGKTRSFVDGIIKFFTGMGAGIRGIFGGIVKGVGAIWEGLKKVTAAPIKWVVDHVYTNGIEAVWNGIAKAVGIPLTLPNANLNFANGGVAHFAGGGTGGVNPGYAPRHDSIPAMTSPGEAWMVPEWTRAVGEGNVHKWNAAARNGGPSAVRKAMGFADGGVAEFSGGGVAGFFGGIGGAIGGAFNAVTGAFQDIGKFLSNPAGVIEELIAGPVNALAKSVPGGEFGKSIFELPLALVKSLTGHAKSSASAMNSGSGNMGSGGGGGSIGGAERWSSMVSQALFMMGQPESLLATTLRRMNQESGGNPNAINNWDINAQNGIPSQGLMQVIPPTFAAYAMPGYNSNILDPMSNILASMHYAISRYGSLAAAYNQLGGYANGGVVPTFDNGGSLAPGLNLLNNNTGGFESLTRSIPNGKGDSGSDSLTIVLNIPELGGRLTAKIESVSSEKVGSTLRKIITASGGSRGVGTGGVVL